MNKYFKKCVHKCSETHKDTKLTRLYNVTPKYFSEKRGYVVVLHTYAKLWDFSRSDRRNTHPPINHNISSW